MIKRAGAGVLFLITALVLSIWSYAYVDPNLVLSQSPIYLQFQGFLVALNTQPWFSTYLYIALVLLLFIAYAWLLRRLDHLKPVSLRALWIGLAIILLLGHNAHSHDIFNYLFNAKMVLQYHADPHVLTALNFSSDPWVRFMHNVDTPAPYGWGWTALSLIPYSLGFGKFILAYFSMKLFMAVGLVLTCAMLRKINRLVLPKDPNRWLLFAFQPLVLVEVLLNGHNDVWMLWPALASIILVLPLEKLSWKAHQLWKSLLGAAILLGFSIWQKYVTVVLLPVMALFLPWGGVLKILADKFRYYWADLAAIALVLPLITPRSQQFHPWYLVWALCFLPFARTKWVRYGLQGLAATSLLRYVPWLANNQQYTPDVELWSRIISWSGLVIAEVWAILEQGRTFLR